MLVTAIVLISSALVAYTVGVWAEHKAGVLRWGHVALFWLGLAFDASGTAVMGMIARSGGTVSSGIGGVLTQIMAVTGAAALILMALHATWAIVILFRNRPSELSGFHKFSTWVWALWLVPYLTGMVSSMV